VKNSIILKWRCGKGRFVTSVISVWEERAQILPPLSTVYMPFSAVYLNIQYKNLDDVIILHSGIKDGLERVNYFSLHLALHSKLEKAPAEHLGD